MSDYYHSLVYNYILSYLGEVLSVKVFVVIKRNTGTDYL